MNKFLKKVQALRDFESGLHHGDPKEDPYEEADKRRMEYLNALTKAPRCRVCGVRLNATIEDSSNPLTVCGKCGGRKAQVRLEAQDRVKASVDLQQGHPRGTSIPAESGKSPSRQSHRAHQGKQPSHQGSEAPQDGADSKASAG